jgi:hypothetical protein
MPYHWVIDGASSTPQLTFKGHIRGFQIGQMSLGNIPVVHRNKQMDFGFCDMFNY